MTRFSGNRKHDVRMRVNGEERQGAAEPRMLLSDFLRHELRLYGTHVGCEHGVCGACTVIVDGRPERSCTQYALQADGADIETVEGLAEGDALSVLQEAFRRHHALQCGFCTAGILMSATRFLRETPSPTRDQVRDMLSGHICRCTGYHGIVEAIIDASETLKSNRSD